MRVRTRAGIMLLLLAILFCAGAPNSNAATSPPPTPLTIDAPSIVGRSG